MCSTSAKVGQFASQNIGHIRDQSRASVELFSDQFITSNNVASNGNQNISDINMATVTPLLCCLRFGVTAVQDNLKSGFGTGLTRSEWSPLVLFPFTTPLV